MVIVDSIHCLLQLLLLAKLGLFTVLVTLTDLNQLALVVTQLQLPQSLLKVLPH